MSAAQWAGVLVLVAGGVLSMARALPSGHGAALNSGEFEAMRVAEDICIFREEQSRVPACYAPEIPCPSAPVTASQCMSARFREECAGAYTRVSENLLGASLAVVVRCGYLVRLTAACVCTPGVFGMCENACRPTFIEMGQERCPGYYLDLIDCPDGVH